MKNAFAFLAFLFIPLSVMAMTPVTDSDLSDVTGQAGVNINADLTMNISIGTLAWGDGNGIGGFNSGTDTSTWTTVSQGGYVGMTGFNITGLRIKARETDNFNGYYTSVYLKPITIDVATGTKNGVDGTTFVRFGTGSLQINMDGLSLGIQLGPTPSLGQVLGTANIGPMGVYFNPDSYIDIYAHSGCGVNFDINAIIDQLTLDYVSWGDTDGLPGGNTGAVNWIGASSTPGYIGFDSLVVGGLITLEGTVAFDIVSQAANTSVYSGQGIAQILGQGACSILHISFPRNFKIGITGPITGILKLDSTPGLSSANAGTLGDIYLSAFNVEIAARSWVDIWAH
jgi:hypothetical protein